MAYTPITAALLEQTVAARALTQLNRISVYGRTGISNYEPGAFQRGEDVKIRRPKRRVAQDVDPRGAGLTTSEGTFFNATVALEKLWGDGFPVYGHDASQAIARYVTETSGQMADSIATPKEDYEYGRFRAWTATTGAVAIGAHPPVQIVANVDSSGNFTDYDNVLLRAAGTVLDLQNVPSNDRFAVMSSTAKGAFLGDSIVVTGFASALNLGSGQLIQTGLPNNQFVERYGFQCAGSNTVSGQAATNMLANAAGGVVASTAANTSFTYADYEATTYVGAVNVTLTASGTTIGGGVGVGQIAKIAATSGGAVVGFGVILRIDTTTATAPVITLVPYAPNGTLLTAAQITTSHTMTIPAVPSVNTMHHREALLIANRAIAEPTPNSGARATTVVDAVNGNVLQLFSGQYDIRKLNEIIAVYLLSGARISDSRKCVLALSK